MVKSRWLIIPLKCIFDVSQVINPPNAWNFLAWVGYCYNTSYHSSLKATPFEAVYGRPPPCLLSYCPGSVSIDELDLTLQSHDEILPSFQKNLLQAQ